MIDDWSGVGVEFVKLVCGGGKRGSNAECCYAIAKPNSDHGELQFSRSRRLSHSLVNTINLSHRLRYAKDFKPHSH